MAIYMGVDPGLDGSLAVLGDEEGCRVLAGCPVDGQCGIEPQQTNGGEGVSLYPVPTVKWKGNKRRYDVQDMARRLFPVNDVVDLCFIERQWSRPFKDPKTGRQQGATSLFSTGFGYGLWMAFLTAFEIPHVEVAPKAWQAAVWMDKGKHTPAEAKARTLAVVQARFPWVDLRARKGCRVPHSGNVDALAIAYAARLHHQGLERTREGE